MPVLGVQAYEIAQKVEVIVEHFRTHTRHKIGGRAKAMVVTNSREHAVRYKLGFDKYLKDKGYTDVKSLVAFSGEITLKEFADKKFTEVGMNDGIQESELPEKFNTEEYQVLLVAEKYQTGFDQPLLHSMYVDKRLSGIQAVQTLSRLNRTTRGKTDTFVLDFVNEPEEWAAAGLKDTLLRWKFKPEKVDEDETAVQPGIQGRGGQAGDRAWCCSGTSRARPGCA